MANLYGQSVGQQGLYGKQQVLSERNQQQAQELGLPSAHAGGAGSQVEANDPFANFEDYFNLNKSWAEGAAKGVGDKVAAEAPPQVVGQINVPRYGPQNNEGTATGKPPSYGPRADGQGVGTGKGSAGEPIMPQLVSKPQSQGLPEATPSNYLTSLQAQADTGLKQLTPSSTGLLSGFADAEVTPHQYEVGKEERADETAAGSSEGTGTSGASGGGSLPEGEPVPQASPEAQAVTPPTTEDASSLSDLESLLKGAQEGADAEVGPSEEELKKLDQLRKVNELLAGWGEDEGQSLLGPEATAWDAALMQTGGGRTLQRSLNEGYGGKDLEYEQELANDIQQRAKEKSGAQQQVDLFSKGIEDEKARLEAEATANAPAQGPDRTGVPDWLAMNNIGDMSLEDYLRMSGAVSSPSDLIWNQIPGAGKSPLDRATGYLEGNGYMGVKPEDVDGSANDSADVTVKRAVYDFKNRYGEEMAKAVWALVDANMYKLFHDQYNAHDIFAALENIMYSYGLARQPNGGN